MSKFLAKKQRKEQLASLERSLQANEETTAQNEQQKIAFFRILLPRQENSRR
jgi:hypothetical protein